MIGKYFARSNWNAQFATRSRRRAYYLAILAMFGLMVLTWGFGPFWMAFIILAVDFGVFAVLGDRWAHRDEYLAHYSGPGY